MNNEPKAEARALLLARREREGLAATAGFGERRWVVTVDSKLRVTSTPVFVAANASLGSALEALSLALDEKAEEIAGSLKGGEVCVYAADEKAKEIGQ